MLFMKLGDTYTVKVTMTFKLDDEVLPDYPAQIINAAFYDRKDEHVLSWGTTSIEYMEVEQA